MNHPKKMVYMQRIFNPSQYRPNSSGSFNKETFARTMIESLGKAMSPKETPPKEKHVRKLLIGTFQAESGSFFWQYLNITRLKEDQVVCWKFCHVLHKMLRDGHKSVISSCFEMRQVLLDCGNLWRHVEEGYGKMIFKYCLLLHNRINFLVRNSRFPNDLKVTDDQLDEIGERDSSVFFDLSCEIFDALDDILRLQNLVLISLDMKKLNSMTSAGQCHLAPLVACIQDSSLLYDYSVKILFKLHASLPASTLEGHRDRFLCQHTALKNFYINTSNLQYFKTLIQIPYLTERPPNFLIASDLKQHVAPQVVMIPTNERDSPDQVSSISDSNSQLLVNFADDQPDDSTTWTTKSTNRGDESNDSSIDTTINSSQSHFPAQPDSSTQELNGGSDLKLKIRELEDLVLELRNELEVERATMVSLRDSLSHELSKSKAEYEELKKTQELTLGKLKSELSGVKCQLSSSKKSLEKLEEECKRAQHDNEISQGAMKKLVKDLSDLKTENANLRLKTVDSFNGKTDTKLVEELTRKVEELNSQLSERDNQSQEWFKEKQTLVSDKNKLEQQLDANQGDLLMIEMNETDKIIKEATKKIEELGEKSRKLESGVKLQVNEKISEVCCNLMMAVRNLIIQSRLLQREVVSEQDSTNRNEFYKRNSAWTEGLVSAANVVAMAARSVVDAADRTMAGSAKYSELAAAAHEVAAATTQLVVASRVKANKDSEKLKILTNASKQVNQCTSNVVDTARVCAELIEQDVDKVDISSLSLHQTKKLEMETQVRLLELEDKLSKERIKLGLLRRQHYEQEEAQATISANEA